MQYSQRLIESTDWVTILLVICFLLFACTKYFYPKRFNEFTLLPITNKYFSIHGKNNTISHPFNMLLFAAQVISVSLFIFLIINTVASNLINISPTLFFLRICTAYTVLVLFKFLIEKIVGNVFSLDTLINQYLYKKLSYRNFLGGIVFIGNLLFFYYLPATPTALFIYGGSILLLNIITLISCYKNNGNMILGNFFYFILYLCALEISPYIILYKALT